MRRVAASLLLVLSIMSTFWAYAIASTLVRDLGKDITYVDLGAVFILGLIAGFGLGLAWAVQRRAPAAE
jgi:hypothetical protein